jgi:hypothetical protein
MQYSAGRRRAGNRTAPGLVRRRSRWSAHTVPGASPMMRICGSAASTPSYWLQVEAKNSSVWLASLTAISCPGNTISAGPRTWSRSPFVAAQQRGRIAIESGHRQRVASPRSRPTGVTESAPRSTTQRSSCHTATAAPVPPARRCSSSTCENTSTTAAKAGSATPSVFTRPRSPGYTSRPNPPAVH